MSQTMIATRHHVQDMCVGLYRRERNVLESGKEVDPAPGAHHHASRPQT